MTLEEYMEELYLMDKQYGQEEELYPLINILLRQSGSVAGLSLRDVHDGEKAESIKHRELLKGFSGFPDLVVFDKEFDKEKQPEENKNYICGCVEAKTKISEFLKNKDGKLKINVGKKMILRFTDGKSYGWHRFSEDNYNVNSRENDKFKKLDINIEDEKEFYYWRNNRKITNKFCELKKIYKDKNIIEYKYGCVCYVDDCIETIDIQLLGELLWYSKVLYTDGRNWLLYECEKLNAQQKENIWNNGGTVTITKKELGDLSKIKYKKTGKYTDKQYQKWKDLVSNLAAISWNPNT